MIVMKKLFKGFVLTQKVKYIIGIAVLALALVGGGVLWYVEENADKPGEAAGIEEDDDDTGLQIGTSDLEEDFEDFEDDFIDITGNDENSDNKKDTNKNNTNKNDSNKDKTDQDKDTLKENDNKNEGTQNSTESGWGRLF